MKAARIRRSRDAARLAILDAAEAILLEEGPDGIAVQRVAAAVGLTDAAIHYHFGNRTGLVEALLRHCGRKLVAEIEATANGREFDLRAVSRAMRMTYGTRRAAQMAMWLKLAGWRARGSGMLTPLIAQAEAAGGRDAQRLVALMNTVHVAIALMGDELLRAAGLPADAKAQDRFLDWATGFISAALAVEQTSE